MRITESQICQDGMIVRNQHGSFMVIAAVSIVVVIAVVAIGVEVGRWYTVRSEMSKAVDAAALVGAKNSSNPYVDPEVLAEQVAKANFQDGLLGTDGSPHFDVTIASDGKVTVAGETEVVNTVGRTIKKSDGAAHEKTLVGAKGAALLRESEVMLVLDRSGSMSGLPWANLQVAAVSFLEFFEDTQADDKFGLIMFDTAAKVYRSLGTDFVIPMITTINGTNTGGGTNPEDALDQADGPDGFTDQTGLPGDQRVQQFVVFFSDGQPTRFRGQFTRGGQSYDAVGKSTTRSSHNLQDPITGSSLGVKQFNTGDGLPAGSSACGKANTKWEILEDSVYGIYGTKAFPDLTGIAPDQCDISRSTMDDYAEYLEEQMAIDHAAELKAKGILIFSVGLGNIDQDFLLSISSGEDYVYHTPDSSELQALFHKIASTIKLRLVL
ncbi:MAG: vWA domain-containing protein [Nitrospirales bacterium]